MHIVLLIVYGLLCSFGIVRLSFIRRSGIKHVYLLTLFWLHVLTGWLHTAIAWRYFPGHGDIWSFFGYSISNRHQMFTDLHGFLMDDWTLHNITHNGVIFVEMVLNIFSFDNLYIDTLLLSFPVFLGNVALFRVFRRYYPDDLPTAATAFLLPSVLFWTSCIHREALLFMLLGFLIYQFDKFLARRSKLRSLIYSLLCFALITFFRGAYAVILIPALGVWLWKEKPKIRRYLEVITLAGIAGILFIGSNEPDLSIPSILAAKQNEFFSLEAHSRIDLPQLDGSWPNLLKTLPYACKNGLFEPLPGSGGSIIYLAFSLELLAIWAVIGWAILRRLFLKHDPEISSTFSHRSGPRSSSRSSKSSNRNFHSPRTKSFTLFALILAIGIMLLTGITVPFAGAIVRYRSIALPFLLAPCLHYLSSLPAYKAMNRRLTYHIMHRL